MNRTTDLRADRTDGRAAGRTVGRISARALLIVTSVLTVVVTAGVLINDLVRIIYMYEGAYDLKVILGSPLGLPANLDGDSGQAQSYLWTALISSQEPLATARLLQSLSIGLTSITFLAAAVAIVVLCRRLWTGRTFTASAAVAILVLAGLALATAWFAPWLSHRADGSALDELGYSTSGPERWVELPYFEMNDSMLMLGVVLVLVGLVYFAAKKLQQETDGLV